MTPEQECDALALQVLALRSEVDGLLTYLERQQANVHLLVLLVENVLARLDKIEQERGRG